AAPGQRRGQAATARVGLGPVAPNGAVDNRRVMRIDGGRALDEAQRRQGDVVDGGAGQALFEDGHARYLRLIVGSGYDLRSGPDVRQRRPALGLLIVSAYRDWYINQGFI